MDKHDFCRVLLKEVRKDAKKENVKIGKILVCRMFRDQWFCESPGPAYPSKYVRGDCAFEAKSNYIETFLSKE